MHAVYQTREEDFIEDVFVMQIHILDRAKRDVLMMSIAKVMPYIDLCQLDLVISQQPLNVHPIVGDHLIQKVSKN